MQDAAISMIANPESFTITEIVATLAEADNLYANGGQSFIEDNEYDALRLIAERLEPAHVYFTGVGAEVRGGKIKLPFEMGSLNQVEIGDIEEWVTKHSLGDSTLVVTDKMDGTSALIVYGEDGKPQIAYSRGNGTEGADITRHIFKIANVPQQVSGKMVVRVEVELTETAFAFLQDKVNRHSSSEPYKNARNMVGGLMNRKENPGIVYEHLTVIAYEVVGLKSSKLDQLKMLSDEGFDVTPYTLMDGHELNDDDLAVYLNERRADTDYAIDGIVIDVNCVNKRAQMNPSNDSLNPEYSIKYKVADESNVAITEVIGVTWNLSKHGYLKPQINMKPVHLVGVTISNCTGFNASFILKNNIGPGAEIQITRSGDVIPFCQKVITPTVADMPKGFGETAWTENDVDLYLIDASENQTVQINQLTDFFAKVEAPMLKTGNITKLFDAGYTMPYKVITASQAELVATLGENGNKVYDGLQKRLEGIPIYKMLGAFSTVRGMGVRKFKKLQNAVGPDALVEYTVTLAEIGSVDGFAGKTAGKAMAVLAEFSDFLADIAGHYTWEEQSDAPAPDGHLNGEKIVFTGFRDADLQAAVEQAGGEMQSGVSSKTTVLVTKDPNSTSGKVQKARDKGIRIVGIEEFRNIVG